MASPSGSSRRDELRPVDHDPRFLCGASGGAMWQEVDLELWSVHSIHQLKSHMTHLPLQMPEDANRAAPTRLPL